uniref:Uncharacterized protein n=1 Tax=Arundo donax TaxID=35708 RepID=A0A0A8YQ52_ARUDO
MLTPATTCRSSHAPPALTRGRGERPRWGGTGEERQCTGARRDRAPPCSRPLPLTRRRGERPPWGGTGEGRRCTGDRNGGGRKRKRDS